MPWLIGGSADLTARPGRASTFDGAGDFEPGSYGGRNLHFGIREHGAAAISNGLSLSKVRPFGSSFFIFTDYARPSIRLSALMELPVIYIFTHDSIGVGEDGPTHQPVEQLASLRAIPGLDVIRPADANEVVEAWRVAIDRGHRAGDAGADAPEPADPRPLHVRAPPRDCGAGGYVLADPPRGRARGDPDRDRQRGGAGVAAHEELSAEGVRSRVVSLPCWELFERQDRTPTATRCCRRSITARVSVEEASTLGWDALRRPRRRDDRHAHLRHLGAAQGRAEEVRLQPEQGGSGRAGSCWHEETSAPLFLCPI